MDKGAAKAERGTPAPRGVRETQKLPLPVGGSRPHLIHSSLGPHKSTPKLHPDWFSHFCTAHHVSNKQTDTQTMLCVTSVAIGRISAMHAMWPNNNYCYNYYTNTDWSDTVMKMLQGQFTQSYRCCKRWLVQAESAQWSTNHCKSALTSSQTICRTIQSQLEYHVTSKVALNHLLPWLSMSQCDQDSCIMIDLTCLEMLPCE